MPRCSRRIRLGHVTTQHNPFRIGFLGLQVDALLRTFELTPQNMVNLAWAIAKAREGEMGVGVDVLGEKTNPSFSEGAERKVVDV